MTNLDWYSNLNAVLTYCQESEHELMVLSDKTAYFVGGYSIPVADIKAHLHHRAKAEFETYVHEADGSWSKNGEKCDAPEVD